MLNEIKYALFFGNSLIGRLQTYLIAKMSYFYARNSELEGSKLWSLKSSGEASVNGTICIFWLDHRQLNITQ